MTVPETCTRVFHGYGVGVPCGELVVPGTAYCTDHLIARQAPAPGHGYCRDCGGQYRLRADGNIRSHKADGYRCAGAEHLPGAA